MKNEKGITLIVLVITIILLCILAGFSINIISGSNGIISKATKAREENTKSSAIEKVEIAYTSSFMTEGAKYDMAIFEEELTNIGGVAITSLEKLPIVVKLDDILIEIKEDRTINAINWFINDENVITNGSVQIAVGTIVNYDCGDVKMSAQKSYTSSKSTGNGYKEQTFEISSYAKGGENELTWEVLGIEDGQILITPTTNISTSSNEEFFLYGSTGYINGVSELDEISKLFAQGNGADTEKSRSIRAEDINNILKYNPTTEKYGKGKIYEYGNIVNYFWDGTKYPYYKGENGIVGNLSILHDNFHLIDGNEYKIIASASRK